MTFSSLAELPATYPCRLCGAEKPIGEMVLVRIRRTKEWKLRPRCKACHNARERGHRREWKRRYLRRWRRRNPELTESYWRQNYNPALNALRARLRFQDPEYHHALLIQGRLRRRAGMKVSLAECRQLLRQFGPCYPTRFGLTPKGFRECERIRSRQRRDPGAHPLRAIEIRLMVYEDGHYIKPKRQRIPFQHPARRLREWHRSRRQRTVFPAADGRENTTPVRGNEKARAEVVMNPPALVAGRHAASAGAPNL